MIKSISAAVLMLACHGACAAGEVDYPGKKDYAPVPAFEVERLPFGSGTPAGGVTTGTETARIVVDGLYHVPNYMPGFPTAATIWPRELPLECDHDAHTNGPACSGYRVLPAVGRGEYIFVRPYTRPAPPAVVVQPPPPPPPPATTKKPLG